jgi:GR25 family glycosyltransferase involved in LPS biosynthesis
MKDLEKLNTNMNKVHKVSGVFIPKNGHKGCVQSHILALNMIKLNKWKRVLILEDDAEIVMPPEIVNEIINKSLEKLDTQHADWNVIMLGTANKILDNKHNDIFLDINSNQDNLKIEKLEFATTGTAYIVKDTYVDSILKLYDTEVPMPTMPNDPDNPDNPDNPNEPMPSIPMNVFKFIAFYKQIEYLQHKDNWYVINKNTIKQRS